MWLSWYTWRTTLDILLFCKLENIILSGFSSDVYELTTSNLALLNDFSSLSEEASVPLSSLTISLRPYFLAYFQSVSSRPELWTFIAFHLTLLLPSKVKLLLDSSLVQLLKNYFYHIRGHGNSSCGKWIIVNMNTETYRIKSLQSL